MRNKSQEVRKQQLVGKVEDDIHYKSFLLTLKLQPDITPKGVSTDFCCREWLYSHLSSPLMVVCLVSDLTIMQVAE